MRTMSTGEGRRLRRIALPVLALGLLAVSACGAGSSSAKTGDSADPSKTTVMIRDASGEHVLTTPDGTTLYVSDQEQGKVLCTSSACAAVWAPLTLPTGDTPTGPGGLELTTIQRPDGTAQVAYDGRPLYTFSFDHAAGQVSGEGQTDRFDGTDFTWHAATPTGRTAAPTSPSSTRGGYNY